MRMESLIRLKLYAVLGCLCCCVFADCRIGGIQDQAVGEGASGPRAPVALDQAIAQQGADGAGDLALIHSQGLGHPDHLHGLVLQAIQFEPEPPVEADGVGMPGTVGEGTVGRLQVDHRLTVFRKGVIAGSDPQVSASLLAQSPLWSTHLGGVGYS